MFSCSECGKRFPGKKVKKNCPIINHINGAHGINGAFPIPYAEVDDHEESMASRHIQATLDEACGIENFDREWLL